MSWFLTKLVFRIVCGDGSHKAQFDEQLRLIQANHPEEALEKARSFAEAEKLNTNIFGTHIKWQFVNITELYRLQNFIDGAELYSQIREEENAELFVEQIHKKALHTQINLQNRLLEIF